MPSEIDNSGKINSEIDLSPNFNPPENDYPKLKLANSRLNQQNDTFPMEIPLIGHDHDRNNSIDETEADIATKTIFDGVKCEEKSLDETECSSSFGCTDSGEDIDGAEVESRPWDDNVGFMGFNGCSDLLGPRKKRVSSHWRDYVRPVMWRCQWVELQIKKLQSQALKYARELDECDKRKQCELETFSAAEHAAKSAPYVRQNSQEKLMKRMKRRRVEDTVDLAAYTASHNLFSYFANKGSAATAASGNKEHRHSGQTRHGNGEFGVNGELPFLESQDNDEVVNILRKIEEAQAHIHQLKRRMDKVVSENAETFISDSSSFLPDQPIGGGPNSALSRANDEPALLRSLSTTFQRLSKKLGMPQTSVFITEQVNPDMTKTNDDWQIGGKCEKIEDKILIRNRPMKEEVCNAIDIQAQLVAQSLLQPEVKTEMLPHVPTIPQEQPKVKRRLSSTASPPKNTNMRGRPKTRGGRWNKRVTG